MVFFDLAKKNVTRKKERSILTIIAVLLAIGAFVSLLSIAEGLYQKTRRELVGRDADVYLLPKGVSPLPVAALGGISTQADTLNPALPDELPRRFKEIDHATGMVRLLQNYEGRGVVVLGIDPAQFDVFLPHLLVRSTGRLYRESKELVVGSSLARDLGLAEGSSMNLARAKYDVVGVAESGTGFQDYFCYMSPLQAMDLGNLRGVHEIWVHLKDPNTAPEVAQEITQAYPDVTAIPEEQYLGSAMEIVRYAWVLQFAIASIGVLISMTAAMNTMLMSTYERLKEFGTLRAIGAPRATVILMILTESLILSMIGGVCGMVLGIMGSRILDAAVVTLFKFSFPLASITPGLILQGLALSAAVGLVGAAIPSWLVYQMEIIAALRSD